MDGKGGLWEALKALADPRGEPALRRRGLRLYALFLLVFHGFLLGLLAFLLPRAFHPLLFPLALAGAAWLWVMGQRALQEENPLAPVVAVGLGGALFFFLGTMGLLLWPAGFLLFLAGAWGFFRLLRRAERAL